MSITFTEPEARRYYAARVPALKRVGNELRGPCPVHKGKRSSFAVNPITGEAYCHSQCGRGWDIIAFEQEITGSNFAEARDSVFSIVGRITAGSQRREVATYDYLDENGELLFQTVRYEPKDFRQRRPNGDGGWIWNLRGVRPVLYRLPELLSRSSETIFVCEGEKDVLSLEPMGVLATCNPMGAGKWRHEYAETLSGRTVVVIPDNDPATDENGKSHYKGQKYAAAVAESLLKHGCEVRIIEFPSGKDATEWLALGGTAEELQELVSKASALKAATLETWRAKWQSPGPIDEWPDPAPILGELPSVQRFDENLLPVSFRPFVRDVAERMQVPLDYPGIVAVLALAGAVSRRAVIQPKENDTGWVVVPNLWGGIVAPPGFMKSPVIQAVVRPLIEIQQDWRLDFEFALGEHEREKEESELKHSAWREEFKKHTKQGKEVPQRPDATTVAPVLRRLIVNDATFEALHQTMSENPAGILVIRDELTGWWSVLDRTGREGERAFCLQAWNGDTGHTIDRIGRGTIHVEACCMSMLGGIQPGRLRSYLVDALHDGPGNDGLIQRFQLLVWPDTDPSMDVCRSSSRPGNRKTGRPRLSHTGRVGVWESTSFLFRTRRSGSVYRVVVGSRTQGSRKRSASRAHFAPEQISQPHALDRTVVRVSGSRRQRHSEFGNGRSVRLARTRAAGRRFLRLFGIPRSADLLLPHDSADACRAGTRRKDKDRQSWSERVFHTPRCVSKGLEWTRHAGSRARRRAGAYRRELDS